MEHPFCKDFRYANTNNRRCLFYRTNIIWYIYFRFKATVTKPGDSVTYYFDIVNSGTVDALVDNYVFESGYQDCAATRVSDHPECKLYDFNSDGVINGSDYSVIKASIKYGLYYTDNNKEIIAGDEIRAGETKHAKLVVEYFSGSIFLLPDGLQITSIKNTPITINYVQSNYYDLEQ